MRLSLTPVALITTLAVGQVAAAPLSVIFISPSPSANDVSEAVMPFRLGHSAGFGRVPIPSDSETPRAIHHYGPPNTTCARAKMMHRMRELSNKLRAAFGLPLLEASITAVDSPGEAHILPYETVKRTKRIKLHRARRRGRTFLRRLRRSIAALSPWESRALSFVLGCGIGALLRMFFVFVVLIFRSVRGSREPAIQFDDSTAGDVPHPVAIGSPPAYSDLKTDILSDLKVTDEKEIGVGSGDGLSHDQWDDIVDRVSTVERTPEGLQVYWTRTGGTECVTNASVFAHMSPKKLIAFYESNLEWNDQDEE